jgi:autotransporter adhesin
LGAGSFTTEPNTVSVGKPGVERRITHVAPGYYGTDAANMDQLREAQQESRRGVAGAVALGSIAQPSQPGKTTWKAGFGHYKDSSALGLGINHWLKLTNPEEAPRIYINAGASISEGGGDDNVYTFGLGGEF